MVDITLGMRILYICTANIRLTLLKSTSSPLDPCRPASSPYPTVVPIESCSFNKMVVDVGFAQSASRKQMTNAPLWYLVYNFHIILLCLLAIVFWVLGSRAPLLYSYDFGQWLLASPKIGTIIWTACGTIIAAVLLFLLKCVLLLMMKQSARVGASLYTIEGTVHFAPSIDW